MQTFRSNLRRSLARIVCLPLLAYAAAANATPVIYTLQTVADGKLGHHVFAEALVTIVMHSDTDHVKTEKSVNGGTLFTNRQGDVEVTVSHDGHSTTARFAPGEVYVYYDTGTGIAGFGSSISPSYPVSLDCSDYAWPSDAAYAKDCIQGDGLYLNDPYSNGTASALSNPTAGAGNYTYTPELLSLAQSLAVSTLITGRVHTCAVLYSYGVNNTDGDLQTCNGPAPRGLRTDKGGFFLQDMIGGTNPGVGPFNWGGWTTANVGYLHVETVP